MNLNFEGPENAGTAPTNGEAPARRGRGRPRKTENASPSTADETLGARPFWPHSAKAGETTTLPETGETTTLPKAAPTPGAPLELDRLYDGDCLELFPRVPDGSVNLVFADPPFNIGYDYDIYDDRRDTSSYLDWARRWGREIVRVLAPDGAFWLAIGDEYAAELKILFHRELGLSLRNWVVWYYTFGVHCTKKFTRSHAHLFYFVRCPKRFTFNDDAVRVPSARQLIYFDARANPKGRLPDDTWVLRPQDVPDGFAPESDTWYVPRVCGTFKERAGFHGCQMPEQLLGRIIRACSNPGETVLDPFGGSGTTLVVAKKLDRRFLGFELSPDYAAAVRQRLDAAFPGQPLEGSPEPLAGGGPNRRTKT